MWLNLNCLKLNTIITERIHLHNNINKNLFKLELEQFIFDLDIARGIL